MSPTTILPDMLPICSYISLMVIAIAVSKKFLYRTHRTKTSLSQGYPRRSHQSGPNASDSSTWRMRHTSHISCPVDIAPAHALGNLLRHDNSYLRLEARCCQNHTLPPITPQPRRLQPKQRRVYRFRRSCQAETRPQGGLSGRETVTLPVPSRSKHRHWDPVGEDPQADRQGVQGHVVAGSVERAQSALNDLSASYRDTGIQSLPNGSRTAFRKAPATLRCRRPPKVDADLKPDGTGNPARAETAD